MELTECYVNLGGNKVNYDLKSGKHPAIYCNPKIKAFVFDWVEVSASHLKENAREVGEGNILKDTDLSSRAVVFKRRDNFIDVEVASYVDNFGVDVFYHYMDGDIQRASQKGTGNIRIPDPSIKKANLESTVVYVDDIRDSSFSLNIEFSRGGIQDEEEKNDNADFDLIKDNSVTGLHENDNPFQKGSSECQQLTEEISTSKSINEAVEKIQPYSEYSDIAVDVEKALQDTSKILDIQEKLKNERDGRNLLSSLVSQRVRKLVDEADSIDVFLWDLEVSDLEPDMKLYDKPAPRKTIAQFKSELENYKQTKEPINVPSYCGLEEAVQLNIADTSPSEKDNSEDDIFSEISTDSTESTESPFEGFNPDQEQVATTPGWESELNKDEKDTTDNYNEIQDKVLKYLVQSRSLDQALDSLNRIETKKLHDGLIEGSYMYEVGEIIDILEAESNKSPSGQFIQDLHRLNQLDKRFMPVLRSVIVSNTLRESNDIEQAIRKISNLRFKNQEIYAGSTSSFSTNVIKLSEIQGALEDIYAILENEDPTGFTSIKNAIQSIPEDSGIRHYVRHLKYNGTPIYENMF